MPRYSGFLTGQVSRPSKVETIARQFIPAAHAEEDHTPFVLPERKIVLPIPKKETAAKSPLDAACDLHAPGDSKCACINNEIFKHDSSWATAGVGKRAKNPCNMRKPGSWKPTGVVGQTKGAEGYFLVFDSLESGINACVELYGRFYTEATPEALVSRWTDGGGQGAYYNNVKNCYD